MRQIFHDIQAGRLPDELKRHGIGPDRRIRVVIETLPSDNLPMTAINAPGGAFDWLADEPDLYDDNDLVERYQS